VVAVVRLCVEGCRGGCCKLYSFPSFLSFGCCTQLHVQKKLSCIDVADCCSVCMAGCGVQEVAGK
jgi:hypothetical protein